MCSIVYDTVAVKSEDLHILSEMYSSCNNADADADADADVE